MKEFDKKSTSTVTMCLTSSTGTWLNGCLQPQHYYVSLDIHDPEQKLVANVSLSFEQAAKMLLYNGEVECTLSKYRDITGKLIEEEVEKPNSVHQRMKERLQDTHEDLLNRIEDIQKDLDAMLNGDMKCNKSNITELLSSVKAVRHKFQNDNVFTVQKAEEELQTMQNNAVAQLGVFLQTKTGTEISPEIIKQIIPISDEKLLIDERLVKTEKDDYVLKERKEKSVDDMTARQISEIMHKKLVQLEHTQIDKGELKCKLFGAGAFENKNKVYIKYISYQVTSDLSLEEAREYMKFLLTVQSANEFKTHWHYKNNKSE